MTTTLPRGGIRSGRAAALLSLTLLAGGCTTGQMVVRGAMPLMDGGLEAMNRETDLELARSAIPATLKMLEGMVLEDPGNAALRLYAAQGFYGYSYSFIDLDDPARAAALYTRCLEHAEAALRSEGFGAELENAPLDGLNAALEAAGARQVPALFWAASCLAKRTDVDRTDPRSIAQLARAASIMERVLTLDENYYYGGPHLFFGVYFGGRAPMLGGDAARAAQHFEQARAASGGRLLIADVLQAEFLARQELDQPDFHTRLTAVLAAPDDLFPEMAFANQVAKARARHLLSKESEWF